MLQIICFFFSTLCVIILYFPLCNNILLFLVFLTAHISHFSTCLPLIQLLSSFPPSITLSLLPTSFHPCNHPSFFPSLSFLSQSFHFPCLPSPLTHSSISPSRSPVTPRSLLSFSPNLQLPSSIYILSFSPHPSIPHFILLHPSLNSPIVLCSSLYFPPLILPSPLHLFSSPLPVSLLTSISPLLETVFTDSHCPSLSSRCSPHLSVLCFLYSCLFTVSTSFSYLLFIHFLSLSHSGRYYVTLLLGARLFVM